MFTSIRSTTGYPKGYRPKQKGVSSMKLTDFACKGAKPSTKPYKLSDGGGLFLLVKPNGSKLWQKKYLDQLGREKLLSFGAYPLTSLSEARELRDRAEKLRKQGIDPSQAKKDAKHDAILNGQNTFKSVAMQWYEARKGIWSEGYAEKIMNSLENNLLPYLGTRPVIDISPRELLDVLRKIEKRGALDIACRARNYCSQIFRYGIQTDVCEHNPADSLKGALKPHRTEHFASIEARELPELIQAVERNDARLYPRTRSAIMLSLYLFVRPGELRQARWSEIDMAAMTWTIPKERMKTRANDHIVPLSKQALAILEEQRKETELLNTDFVFPSQINLRKPMSDGTVVNALKKLGFRGRMTAHGFRALARTTIREELDYPPDVIEAQLAHKPMGALGAAYDRAKFINKRREMMQDWADYIDRACDTRSAVIHATFKKQA
jgi:integrase